MYDFGSGKLPSRIFVFLHFLKTYLVPMRLCSELHSLAERVILLHTVQQLVLCVLMDIYDLAMQLKVLYYVFILRKTFFRKTLCKASLLINFLANSNAALTVSSDTSVEHHDEMAEAYIISNESIC